MFPSSVVFVYFLVSNSGRQSDVAEEWSFDDKIQHRIDIEFCFQPTF